MITALIVIYIILLTKSKYKISKIKNPIKVTGHVNGYGTRVDTKKRWTYDVVTFMINNELFTSTKTSSPFYLKTKSNIGKAYEVIYNQNNPKENIIIENEVFTQIKRAICIICSFYAIVPISLFFPH